MSCATCGSESLRGRLSSKYPVSPMLNRSLVTALCLLMALATPSVGASGRSSNALQDLQRQAEQARAEAERIRQEAERAREQARQERQRAAEQARIEREAAKAEAARAREQARQEREAARAEAARVREQARQAAAAVKARAAPRANEPDDDGPSPAASIPTAAPAQPTQPIQPTQPATVRSTTAVAPAKKPAAVVSDDDDDDDRPAATSNASGSARAPNTKNDDAARRSRPASKAATADDGPPDTIVEALKRLFATSPPAPVTPPRATEGAAVATGSIRTSPAATPKPMAAGASPPGATGAPSATGGAQTKSAAAPKTVETAAKADKPKAVDKAEPAKKPVPPIGKLPTSDPLVGLRPGEHRPNELLAMNMTPKAIEAAKANGLVVVNTVTVNGSTSTISRIILPRGMPPHAARHLLAPELPFNAFAPNRIYRLYMTANSHGHAESQTAPAPIPAAPRVPGGTELLTVPPAVPGAVAAGNSGCSSSRCFGTSMIGWQDHLSSCTAGVRVGVIDTAIDRTHPALKQARVTERQFTPDGTTATKDGHGTGVIAILAGNQRSGTPGLAPNADYYVANVFGNDAQNRPVSDTFSLLKAIEWLDRADVRIVNISLSGPHDNMLQKAIEDYSAKGMTFVAAAGNEGPNARPSYPAAYPQVVAVTAVDRNLRGYLHANRGSYIDVAAPGVSVWTALPNAQEGPLSGTSFAVPYVTAMLAAVHSGAKDRSKDGLLQMFETQDLGPAGRDSIYGRGLLKAPAACRPGELNGIAQIKQPWAATVVPASIGRTR